MNCEKCVFRGKTPAVLHVRKKHYVSEAHVHLIFQGAALNYGQLTFCNHIKCNCSSFPVIKKLHYWCKFFAFEMVNVSRIYIHEIHGCDAIPGNYKPPHHSLCSIKGYNQVRVSLIQIILILMLLLRRSTTNWTWKNAQYKVTRFQNLKDKILTWKEEEKTSCDLKYL